MSAMNLRIEQTLQVSQIRHRLALGVQWINALTRMPAGGPWVSDLESIGSRACAQRFDLHPQSRHALRWAGRLARTLALAAEDKALAPPLSAAEDQTNFCLRGFSSRDLQAEHYCAELDTRQFVPRRLSLTPALNAGMPVGHAGNIRQIWLWPGAAFPLSANSTAIRGRILRGPDLAHAKPVPWARIVVTLPGPLPIDFNTSPKVGWGHGDDRGEFLVVLGAQAVSGGAILPHQLNLQVWVFLPPNTAPDPADPLARLPLEQAGSDAINDVLRGIEVPADYVRQVQRDVVLKPGEVLAMNDAVLQFP